MRYRRNEVKMSWQCCAKCLCFGLIVAGRPCLEGKAGGGEETTRGAGRPPLPFPHPSPARNWSVCRGQTVNRGRLGERRAISSGQEKGCPRGSAPTREGPEGPECR